MLCQSQCRLRLPTLLNSISLAMPFRLRGLLLRGMRMDVLQGMQMDVLLLLLVRMMVRRVALLWRGDLAGVPPFTTVHC